VPDFYGTSRSERRRSGIPAARR